MSLVIGVTGGIGSGKSAVTGRFQQHGIEVVDADVAARVVVEPGGPALDAIAAHFGQEILLANGQLDRAALRQKVFADADERRWLEQLTHPLIGQEIRRQLEAATSPYVILASPLLLETSQVELADVVVVVDVPEAIQLERTMARDDNEEAQVRRIMAAQMPRDQRLASADIVIDNTGPLSALDDTVSELHREFLARAEMVSPQGD
ncbi:dephospho-CoA kinase [Pseudohalioglobus sediminis]|uniref:Dephospho-CoA kinase n=1 Tax=Pseudohalioglobus sediminis TaxID=2606449 RepID=A0A5B0X554_9GAMM|nr:dephospho-CoA kinase [Pseudohalioglobus sediminis]KAA1194480.1 dephospho-CoA kinase [Pseudohalioglobus sediminis]